MNPTLEASEAEMQDVLDALASPLVGILIQREGRCRPSNRRIPSVQRLHLLASAMHG